MRQIYVGAVLYKNGVGTRTDVATGNLFGSGIGDRVEDELKALKDYLSKNPDEPVDVIGFSRGAASARIFANRVTSEIPCAKIRFLGLFDTVAQIGMPNWFNFEYGYDLSVHPETIGFTAHAVAENEFRSLFPLTSISKDYSQGAASVLLLGPHSYAPADFQEIKGENYWEKPFAGAHSDLGGGYQNGRSMDALRWMIQQGQAAGAPFQDLESYQYFDKLQQITTPHDSRYPVLDLGSKHRVIFAGNL